jgi:hypothetical protein
MSKRFGKKRVPDCQCTYNFTCGPCLRAAGPTREAMPRTAHDVMPGEAFERGGCYEAQQRHR